MENDIHLIIISNTNIRRKDFKIYLDYAAEYGYETEEVVCDGGFKSIHNVPDEVVKRMQHSLNYSLANNI